MLQSAYDAAQINDTIQSRVWTFTEDLDVNRNISVTMEGGYDNDGLLTSAGSLTIARDSQNGLLTGTAIGNVTTSLGHNGFAEVTGESASYSGTSLYNSSFVYDNLGRIIEKTETVDSVTNTYAYGYDLAGRLETVDKNGTALSTYAYDANGNRLSLTTSGGTVSGTYDDHDRLTTYGGATYTYTANGELETKTIAADTTTYNYDAIGNLISVTLPDSTLIEYIIDGKNRRVAKSVNGVFAEGYLYKDQLNPVAIVDNTGAVITRFVYADKGNVPSYMIQGTNTYRIISDHLGSTRVVIDVNTGIVTQRMDYDEFGNVILDTNPGFQPFGFAGGLYDHHTKLVRFGARDYDPETGRWTIKDPIRFAGGDTNIYGYVLNNPVNFVDPYGEAAIAVGICIAGMAGDIGLTTYALDKYADEMIEIKKEIKSIEDQCTSLEDYVKHYDKLENLRKQAIEIADKQVRARGTGYAFGIPIAIFCVAAPILPF